MATLIFHLRRNRDGTITIRVGRQVEHVSTESKTRADLYDQLKYALISKGILPSNERLIRLLQEVLDDWERR